MNALRIFVTASFMALMGLAATAGPIESPKDTQEEAARDAFAALARDAKTMGTDLDSLYAGSVSSVLNIIQYVSLGIAVVGAIIVLIAIFGFGLLEKGPEEERPSLDDVH